MRRRPRHGRKVRCANRLRCFATGGRTIESLGESSSLASVTAATAMLTVGRTRNMGYVFKCVLCNLRIHVCHYVRRRGKNRRRDQVACSECGTVHVVASSVSAGCATLIAHAEGPCFVDTDSELSAFEELQVKVPFGGPFDGLSCQWCRAKGTLTREWNKESICPHCRRTNLQLVDLYRS